MFVNIQECDILRMLAGRSYPNQRALSEASGHSIGVVNRSLRALTEDGWLDSSARPTGKALERLRQTSPRRAIILAAGFGMRMVPINLEAPKALLEVNGQTLIERLIGQLREAGIRDIAVVVGFMKDQFEYLMDAYGVELIVNGAYASRNNLHSLALAGSLDNAYIVPCDIWCAENPFRSRELYSWYMVSEAAVPDSAVRVNRRQELVAATPGAGGNAMIGICYLTGEQARTVRERLLEMDGDSRYESCFWEEALTDRSGRLLASARVVPADAVVEIDTYEQLRELDSGSNHLKSEAIAVICEALNARENDITDISVLKKGMTNRSFLFSCRGGRYIMRIPGEGTDRLINRAHEAAVYRAIRGRGLCDDPVYINPENGYKITTFLEDARVCDPGSVSDLRRCMAKLKQFHRMNLRVDHDFDIFGQIDFYERLWEGEPSVYKDYSRTREAVFALREYIDAQPKALCLTHIDAVPDNFLFHGPEGGKLQLTDWEYSGMQDPHVDIAMFGIYSLYDREAMDRLIDLYFEDEGGCPEAVRIKIYCYVAACGLLWSNWCEYKRKLGVEFGEYSLRQYRYAKDYCRLARAGMARPAREGDEAR